MTITEPTDPLLDLLGIADRCNISERMARRLISERRLPVVKVGRHVRVRSSDLEAYLHDHTLPAVRAR